MSLLLRDGRLVFFFSVDADSVHPITRFGRCSVMRTLSWERDRRTVY